MKKAKLTLYTAGADPDRIRLAIRNCFWAVTKSVTTAGKHTTLILQDDSRMIFSLSHVKQEAAFLEMHLQGMADYFSTVPVAEEVMKENLLRQIGSFDGVTGIVFETDENDDRSRYLLNTLFDVAQEVNGFLLYPNLCIYTGRRELVFSPGVRKEAEGSVSAVAAPAGKTGDNQAGKKRRERSVALLKERKIPYVEGTVEEIREEEIRWRGREELVKRAIASFAVALYAEILLSEKPDRQEALSYVDRLDELYGVRSYFSPAETAYIEDAEPETIRNIQFVWRYECCALCLWAAGIVEELPYPSEISDIPVFAALFWQHAGLDGLLAEGFPREQTELLDTADVYRCYSRACIAARSCGKEVPALLDVAVVLERQRALEWMTGGQGAAAWDEVKMYT